MFRFKFRPDEEEHKITDAHLRAKIMVLRTELFRAVDRSSKFVKGQAQLHLSGEFLKVRTGRLRGSVKSDAMFTSPGVIQGIVGTNVWYGQLWQLGWAYNEKGDLVRFTSRIPRPWLSVAMQRKFNYVWKQLTKAVKMALEK